MLDFLVWLQGFRNPVLDFIVEAITISAEETVLLAAVCIIYWCVNKRWGYIVGLAIVLSACLKDSLKDLFKVERPWVLDDRIIPIRQETATGYSFPSGHTQTGGALWASLAILIKSKAFRVVAVIMMLLIAFSRVYLSVHTPLDVGVALVLACLVAAFSYKMIDLLEHKGIYLYLMIMIAVLIGLMFVVRTDSYYKMAGVTISFVPGYYLEHRYIRFSVKGSILKQILKVVIGIAIALGIRLGLGALFPEMIIFDFIRYFTMGISILALAPWIFIKTKLSKKLPR